MGREKGDKVGRKKRNGRREREMGGNDGIQGGKMGSESERESGEKICW